MKEKPDENIGNSSQNIDLPKEGDDRIKNLIEGIKIRIEKKGLNAADELFTAEEVTDETREKFNEIWKKVWVKEEYHEGDIEKIESHYAEYDQNSKDIIVYTNTEEGRVAIGTMRLIDGKKGETPAFKDFELSEEWKKKKRECVEFTLLTILPEWRGLRHINTFLLWREGYRYMKQNNRDYIILITDEKLVGILERTGFPVKKISIGPDKQYEGGPSSVYTIPIEEVEKQFQKVNPEAFQWFTQGIDPETIAKPEE